METTKRITILIIKPQSFSGKTRVFEETKINSLWQTNSLILKFKAYGVSFTTKHIPKKHKLMFSDQSVVQYSNI